MIWCIPNTIHGNMRCKWFIGGGSTLVIGYSARIVSIHPHLPKRMIFWKSTKRWPLTLPLIFGKSYCRFLDTQVSLAPTLISP